jgi:outer membrane protein
MNRQWIIVLLGVFAATSGRTEDLLGVYQRALAADPTMQQAEYTHLAARETKTQAILGLIPLNVYAQKNWSGTYSNGSDYAPNIPATLNAALTVNLFSWAAWVNFVDADHIVAQAEATYIAAQEDLIFRVANQYFNVLSAQDALEAQQIGLESAQKQLDQADKRFEVGLIAVTDVETARASRDSYSAAVLAAKRTVAVAWDLLRAITAENYQELAGPRPDMPLIPPSPASEDQWVTTALQQNATLTANRLAADISHDAYLAAFGGHLPQVTVSATKAWALGANVPPVTVIPGPDGTVSNIIDTRDILWQVGVTVPLFTAGATQSKVRQARYTWDAAKSGLETTRRSTQEQTQDAYQGVNSQIAQVVALRQAVESNRVAMEATDAGYAVGTKNAVDVLTARQLLVAAQTSYAQAKYAYLTDYVALWEAAGVLDRSKIDLINSWLAEPATAPPAAPATAPAATTPPAASGN